MTDADIIDLRIERARRAAIASIMQTRRMIDETIATERVRTLADAAQAWRRREGRPDATGARADQGD